MPSAIRVAGLVAAAGIVLTSVAVYRSWPTVETRRSVCERRMLARMGFAAREKLPREDAGDGATRVASALPAETEARLRERAKQICAAVPDTPEPTAAIGVRTLAAAVPATSATALPECCASTAAGCSWWSTVGCPDDPRPTTCCKVKPDGSCEWWSRMGCP